LWARQQGILDSMVGLKFFNVYGPNEDHKGDMRSVVAKAYEQITAEGSVKLFESYRPGIRDGEQTRDFLYVKDAVAIALHLGRSPHARGLFNVGSGVARTWNDLVSAIFTALERPKNITYIPMPDVLRGKYQYRTEATIDKLRASGYSAPFTTLEEGVWEYVCRYLVPGVTLGTELPSPTGAGSARSTSAIR
jgi:ADP-L-glycero-D-manno-heptose 6-epimerase